MPSLETLRLTWERRVLSILRIMVGMLYMEHASQKSWISRTSQPMCPTPRLP